MIDFLKLCDGCNQNKHADNKIQGASVIRDNLIF